MERNYPDIKAAEELKSEMYHYARNPEAFVESALDFCEWLVQKKGAHSVASEIHQHKLSYLAIEKTDKKGKDLTDREEKIKSLHRCINGTMKILQLQGYDGVAIVLDNWRSKYLGEPEDHLE